MMTRKKIYTYFALLFCAPIALFSAKGKHTIVGVRIKHNDGTEELHAVFVSTKVTLEKLYETLNKVDPYKDNIENLLLYTNEIEGFGDIKEGFVMWDKNLDNPTSASTLSASGKSGNYDGIKKRSLSDIAENRKGFQEGYQIDSSKLNDAGQAWYNQRQPDSVDLESVKEKFANVSDNTDPKNNDILIINETGEVKGKGDYSKEPLLYVKSLTGDTIILEEVEPSFTIAKIKEMIDSKGGGKPSRQRLIYQTNVLEDQKTLTECKITLEKGNAPVINLILSLDPINSGGGTGSTPDPQMPPQPGGQGQGGTPDPQVPPQPGGQGQGGTPDPQVPPLTGGQGQGQGGTPDPQMPPQPGGQGQGGTPNPPMPPQPVVVDQGNGGEPQQSVYQDPKFKLVVTIFLITLGGYIYLKVKKKGADGTGRKRDRKRRKA